MKKLNFPETLKYLYRRNTFLLYFFIHLFVHMKDAI